VAAAPGRKRPGAPIALARKRAVPGALEVSLARKRAVPGALEVSLARNFYGASS